MENKVTRFTTLLKRSYLLILASSMSVLLMPGQANADTTTGLRAYYCFESSLTTDCSGNNNNGVATGDVSLVKGKIGKGAKFGGFDSLGYIQVPNSRTLSLKQNFTIAYWGKVNSFVGIDGYNQRQSYGIQIPLAKSHDRSGIFTELTAFSATPPPDGTKTVPLNAAALFAGGQGSVAGQIDPYTLGEWVHVAYTFTKNTGVLKLYLNGQLADSKVLGSSVDLTQVSTDDLFLGAQAPLLGQNSYQYPFNGVLDDVRIYNRALKPSDVSELFGTGNCDNLEAGTP